MSKDMRIAVDAMGGDNAPDEVVQGAVEALEDGHTDTLLLVGEEKSICALLKDIGAEKDERIRVVNAPDVIGMGEHPLKSLKRRPRASVLQAVHLVRRGEADAVISAGNTGAFVAASILLLKLLESVKRPGIAVPFPAENSSGICTIIDAGANLHCKPIHYIQYSVMGSIYTEAVLDTKNPRVGLINVGRESTKGPEHIREAHRLLKQYSPVNFVGNVEGQELFGDTCDVAVCEGLVGNSILKVAEGMGEGMLRWMKRALESYLAKGGDPKVKEALFAELNRLGNYSEYGGAPLLGVNGVCIICHGRSNANAIVNAMKVAKKVHTSGVNDKINRTLASLGLEWWRPSRWMEFIRWSRENEEK